MKKKCYRDIQRQVICLIPIIESCIALTVETELTKNKLDTLSEELENFKQQTNYLNLESAQNHDFTSVTEIEDVEFKLDSLINDLELVFTSLATFDDRLKNVVVLKEKLEALQEERLYNITPERIHKLLEKQQQLRNQKNISSSESHKNNTTENSNSSIWQKVVKLKYKLGDWQIAFGFAIIASLSFGWLAGYHSSTDVRVDKNKTVEATQKSTDYSANVRVK